MGIDSLDLIEAMIHKGDKEMAISALCDFIDCTRPHAELLVEALARDPPTLADVVLFKEQGWTIHACLRYKKLFADDMNLIKQIVDSLGEPVDSERIADLVSNGDNESAQLLIRKQTGLGPRDAAEEVQRVRLVLVQTMVSGAKEGRRLEAIRAYARMQRCSLSEAKAELEKLLQS